MDEKANSTPGIIDGSFYGLAQSGLELGRGQLKGIWIRGIGWQVEELCTHCLDRFTYAGNFVAGKVIDDDRVAWRESRDEHLFDGSKQLQSGTQRRTHADKVLNRSDVAMRRFQVCSIARSRKSG